MLEHSVKMRLNVPGNCAIPMETQLSTIRRDWPSLRLLPLARDPVPLICGYVIAYLVLDRLSLVQVLDGVGFTLWNPPPACSLALLLSRGLRYTPALFVAGVLADALVEEFPAGLAGAFVANAVIAVGYAVVAAVLLRKFRQAANFWRLANVTWALLVIGIGVLVIASVVTASLLAMHRIPGDRFAAAVRHFWIGDFTGIVGLLPALLLARSAWDRWRELSGAARSFDLGIFALGLILALWVVFGATSDNEFQYFYLLLLPICWIGVQHGLAWSAIANLIEQVAMISLVAFLNYPRAEFLAFQELSLAIACTGLALGAVVTERQRAELSLRRQQAELDRMARLTTAGALGAAIVHEISQPLATIATYVRACCLLLRSEPVAHTVLLETLEKTQSEALRAGEIVERLRDVLSNRGGRRTSLDLAEVARRITALLGDEARAKEVRVLLEAEPASKVAGDSVQIEQVLLNLVRNALEAASERAGEKWVRIRVYQVSADVHLAIEDNGPGVLPDIAEVLFEPFETSKPRGLGLGLSLSRRIVEAHGGKLWLDDTCRMGARFVLSIPCERLDAHDH